MTTTTKTATSNAVKFGSDKLTTRVSSKCESPDASCLKPDVDSLTGLKGEFTKTGDPVYPDVGGKETSKAVQDRIRIVKDASDRALNALVQSLTHSLSGTQPDLARPLTGSVLSSIGMNCLSDALCVFFGDSDEQAYQDIVFEWWAGVLRRIGEAAVADARTAKEKKGGAQ